MADLLNTIESTMEALIGAMTVSGGYNYNWGTINQPDEAKCSYPSACIYITEENCLDEVDGIGSEAYTQRVEFEIHVIGEMSSVNTVPTDSINTVHNKALGDLKMLFGNNLSISSTCDQIMYQGMTRENYRQGDVLRPGKMITRWSVWYTQDRADPEVYGGL